jgi:GNAT superfamily N-acetyltransferase
VAYVAGTPAGYYELEQQTDGSVRIECFGLLRQFFDQGLGSTLLTKAVERCWAMGANRVWLTTCNHDHPHALRNYLARGFQLVKETIGPHNLPRESVLFTVPKIREE